MSHITRRSEALEEWELDRCGPMGMRLSNFDDFPLHTKEEDPFLALMHKVEKIKPGFMANVEKLANFIISKAG